MSALTGSILFFLVLGVLYFIDYFLPTWLGTVQELHIYFL